MDISPAPQDATPDLAPDTRLAQKERRRARNMHLLTNLYDQRSDLLGLNPAAELVAESVRWSA